MDDHHGRGEIKSMTPWETARLVLCGFLATCALLALTLLVPVHAQQGRIIDPDASAVNEQRLLEQSRRIEGRVVLVDEKAGTLMQPAGRTWRFFHEVVLRWIGAIAILGTLLGLAIAYAVIGPLRTSGGWSGIRIPRFSGFERFAHWLTATSFVLLALTGLNITFGKVLLLPLIGPEAFTTLSEIAKYVHNFVSFPFVLGLIVIALLWMRDNIPTRVDVEWLKQGGGFIRGRHPTAGRFNAGEKLVFWLALAAGAAVAISGYILMFPFYVTNVLGMQLAQVLHSIVAILFIALILGHIYIGTLGTEGAFEAMGTGSVDVNWAREHHGLWLQEEIAKGHVSSLPQNGSPRPAE
jgi:formate dehydrogenase subunit gamma